MLQLNIQLAGTKASSRLSMLTSNKSRALETLTRKGSYHHGKHGSDPHRLDTMTLSEVANSHQRPLDIFSANTAPGNSYLKISNTQGKGLMTSDSSPTLLGQHNQSSLPRESLLSHSENPHRRPCLPPKVFHTQEALAKVGVKVNQLINVKARDGFRNEGKTTYLSTHFDESMKYITSAPMLRAKTKTTCKRREKHHQLRGECWEVYLFTFWTHAAAARNMVFSGACLAMSSPCCAHILPCSRLLTSQWIAASLLANRGQGRLLYPWALGFYLALLSQGPASLLLKSTHLSGKKAGKKIAVIQFFILYVT